MTARARALTLVVALCAASVHARAQNANATTAIVGTWRGTSLCTPAGKPTCHDEVVVYRVRELPESTASGAAGARIGAARIEIVMNKIVQAKEDSMGTLSCAHAAGPHLVACPMRGWSWTFEQRADTLSGTLANPTGVVWRNIRVTRGPRTR